MGRLVYCLVDQPTGTQKAASDATAVSWFSVKNLDSVDTHEAVLKVVEQACGETIWLSLGSPLLDWATNTK